MRGREYLKEKLAWQEMRERERRGFKREREREIVCGVVDWRKEGMIIGIWKLKDQIEGCCCLSRLCDV